MGGRECTAKLNYMKKLMVVVLVLIAIAAVGYYNWNRKNASISGTDAAFTASSSELFTAFEADEAAANTKYLNKIVEVNGKVRELKKESNGDFVVTLDGSDMFGVICRMDPGIKIEDTALVGKDVVLKGICTGMLMDVVLVQCVFTNS